MFTPIYDAVCRATYGRPSPHPRHRLTGGYDAPTEEIPVGRHYDDDGDGIADAAQKPALDEAYDALGTDVLSDMDPAADPMWPGIAELDEHGRPDAFPGDWGDDGPTERDQAAIDAGNAPEATDEEVLG